MNKPHFRRTHGYWVCHQDGYSGAGWTKQGAWKSMLSHRRWYANVFGAQVGF